MSISSAKNSSPTTPEPLESLLETIRRAHSLTEADSFEPRAYTSDSDDPLAGLRQAIASEAAYQAQTTPDQWPTAGQDDGASVDQPGAAAGGRAGQAPVGPAPVGPAPAGAGVEARVGREVLAMLRRQPLPGPARASAVERLADQLDDPDTNALRDVLAILVTGHSGS